MTPRAFLLTGSLLTLAGCADPSAKPGPFAGANGAAAASQITRASNVTTGESLATGANVNTMAQATVFILAKHQATVRQRQIAVQHARAAVARLSGSGKRTSGARRKPLPRYLAVETARDEHTAPQAKKAVMLWDTQTQEVVGNNVYDIANPPPAGAFSRFETYSAEYVGAGL